MILKIWLDTLIEKGAEINVVLVNTKLGKIIGDIYFNLGILKGNTT